jgi:Xaa-Pro aminopeptidase
MTPPFDAQKLDRLLDKNGVDLLLAVTRHNVQAHGEYPLEAGMVLSIETGIKQPEAGFIKLEDTVVVTETGWEAYGDWGRDWNEVTL